MVTLIKFTIQLAYFSCSNLGAMCILYNSNYAFMGTKDSQDLYLKILWSECISGYLIVIFHLNVTILVDPELISKFPTLNFS